MTKQIRKNSYNAHIASGRPGEEPRQALYTGIRPGSSIVIHKIYSVHYYEYMNDFSFPGEKHDFWEVVCVDRGEIQETVDDKKYILERDDVLFLKPGVFHSVNATGKTAPNMIIFSFDTDSEAVRFFEDRLLCIDAYERNLLAQIIREARATFEERLDLTYQMHLARRPDRPFGSEQMLRMNMEMFLIHILRRYMEPVPALHTAPALLHSSAIGSAGNDRETRELTHIIDYLETHIHETLTVEKICRDNMIGRSRLQHLFSDQLHMGVIAYFSLLKIEAAKQLIRLQEMNLTQIADTLGYSSIHYFSRQFRQHVGMSPTEYSLSLLARAEDRN